MSSEKSPEEQAVLETSLAVHTIVLETLVECGSRWPLLMKWASAVLALKQARRQASGERVNDHRCHSGKDGECYWQHCPQLRDKEPAATRRHCPYDTNGETEALSDD